jgi:hypothetical protein
MTHVRLGGLFLVLVLRAEGTLRRDDACHILVEEGEWRPIRIGVEYDEFKGIPLKTIENFKSRIVPGVIEYLESTLKVRRHPEETKLQYNRQCLSSQFGYCVSHVDWQSCGEKYIDDEESFSPLDLYECPGESVDDCYLSRTIPAGSKGISGYDLYLHITPHYFSSLGGILAQAITCGRDACGRATIGGIMVTNLLFGKGEEALSVTMLHEIIHILGFTIDDFSSYMDRDTGDLLVPRSQQFRIMFWVERNDDGSISSAGFLKSIPIFDKKGREIFVHNIPYGVIRTIEGIRGVEPNSCRCPIDPRGEYTDSDLLRCLQRKRECLLAVKTKKVLQTAQKYYACDSVLGMELQNSKLYGDYLDPHWKYRTLANEVMNTVDHNRPTFVSPMTLTLLEDSGWYLVNYSAGVTKLIPGLFWGYQDGCAFIESRCEKALKLPYTTEFNSVKSEPKCSSSTFGYGKYTPHANLYHLLTRERHGGWASDAWQVEFCPMHAPIGAYSCTNGETGLMSRCIDTLESGPQCVRDVLCNHDRSGYSFVDDDISSERITCTRKDEIVDKKYICMDPAKICARLEYPHLPKSPKVKRDFSESEDEDDEDDERSTRAPSTTRKPNKEKCKHNLKVASVEKVDRIPKQATSTTTTTTTTKSMSRFHIGIPIIVTLVSFVIF